MRLWRFLKICWAMSRNMPWIDESGMRVTVHTVEALARDLTPEEDFPSDVFGVARSVSEDPTARPVI